MAEFQKAAAFFVVVVFFFNFCCSKYYPEFSRNSLRVPLFYLALDM